MAIIQTLSLIALISMDSQTFRTDITCLFARRSMQSNEKYSLLSLLAQMHFFQKYNEHRNAEFLENVVEKLTYGMKNRI